MQKLAFYCPLNMRHAIANANDTLEECRCLLFFVIIFFRGMGRVRGCTMHSAHAKMCTIPQCCFQGPQAVDFGNEMNAFR